MIESIAAVQESTEGTACPRPAGSGLWAIWRNSHLSDPDSIKTAGIGALLVLVGCSFLIISCTLGDTVNTAVACIEWSCKCVKSSALDSTGRIFLRHLKCSPRTTVRDCT